MDGFSDDCDLFSLTFSQKKTNVMGQGIPCPPDIKLHGQNVELAHQFRYLEYAITDNLSVDTVIIKRIGMASARKSASFPEPVAFFTQIRSFPEYCSYVWGVAPESFLNLLDKVQSKATRLINNPSLTISLQFLSHRCLFAHRSIFYRYFHGHYSLERNNIIPDTVKHARPTKSKQLYKEQLFFCFFA